VAATADWPVDLRGITETIVTTRGPRVRWNVAALGVHAPPSADEPVTARTWGETRTRRNFDRRGQGYVQFSTDPVDFAKAALTVDERDKPVLDSAAAWARTEVTPVDRGTGEGTTWVEWELEPVETAVEGRVVPTTNRGYAAVVEATVAASRLDVPAYDRAELTARLSHLEDVVHTCGSPTEQRAFEIVRDAVGW